MKRKKKHPMLTAFLWICFLAVLGAIVYLSFLNVEQYRNTGKQFIQYAAERKYAGRQPTEEEMKNLTYEIRQAGRMIVFFILGFLGTMTIHLSFRRCNWIIKTGGTAVLLISVAYLTEKLKVYFPGRHYSHDEMMLSITAVSMGFLLVSLITICFHALRYFFRVITTAIH